MKWSLAINKKKEVTKYDYYDAIKQSMIFMTQ